MHRENKFVALTKCFFCGESGNILLDRRFRDISKLDGAVISTEPCQKCRGFMEQGIIVITIDAAKSTPGWGSPPVDAEERKGWIPNPYRTGGFFVIKEEAMDRLNLPENLAQFMKRRRFMFMEHAAAEQLGFFAAENQPKEEVAP